MSKFINLTPHTITIIDGDATITIPASGVVARVDTIDQPVADVLGVKTSRQVLGDVQDLPEKTDDYLIVSGMVRAAVPNRTDVFSPASLVRNSDGQPIGCNGLISN